MEISSDFSDLLRAFNAAKAEYLVIGAYAVGFHDAPRATADFDLWVGTSQTNATRVYEALADFGAPLDDVSADDFATPDLVYMIGVVPFRVDILTTIDGVTFEEAWPRRIAGTLGSVPAWFIGREDLIANKTATARDKDLLDVRRLRASAPKDGAQG